MLVQWIVAGEHGERGPSALKHVVEVPDKALERSSEKLRTAEYHVPEVLKEPLLVIHKAVQLTANGVSLENGADVPKLVAREFKQGQEKWSNLQDLEESFVLDILPNQERATFRLAQLIANGVIIVFGVNAAKHVEEEPK